MDAIQIIIQTRFPRLPTDTFHVRVVPYAHEPGPEWIGAMRRYRHVTYYSLTTNALSMYSGNTDFLFPVVLAVPVRRIAGVEQMDSQVRIQVVSGSPKLMCMGMVNNVESDPHLVIGDIVVSIESLTGSFGLVDHDRLEWLEYPIVWNPVYQQYTSTFAKEQGWIRILPLRNLFWNAFSKRVVDYFLYDKFMYPMARSMALCDETIPKSGGRSTLATELCYESVWSFDIPAQVLKRSIELQTQNVRSWENVYDQTRIAQCRFDSEMQAAKHGYHFVKIAVVAGYNIKQVQQDVITELDKNTVKKNMAGMFSSFVQSTSSKSKPTSGKLCNPFVRLSYEHPAGHRVILGQTKTVSRSDNPRFTSMILAPGSPASLVDQDTLGFFVPCTPDVLFQLELFHERSSGFTQKAADIPMMQGVFPLSSLISNNTFDHQINVSLTSYENDPTVLGQLGIKLYSNRLEKANLFDNSKPTEFPTNPIYYEMSMQWLDAHLTSVHEDMSNQRQFLEACEKSMAPLRDLAQGELVNPLPLSMKRSVEKKSFEVGAIPTNVQVSYLVIESLTVLKSHARLSLSNMEWVPPTEFVDMDHLSLSDDTVVMARPPPPPPSKATEGGAPLKNYSSGGPMRPPPPRAPTNRNHHPPPPPPKIQRTATPPMMDADAVSERKHLGTFPFTTCGIPAAHCLGLQTQDALLHALGELRRNKQQCPEWDPTAAEVFPKFEQRKDITGWLPQFQKYAESYRIYTNRESVVLCQALSILVSCFVSELILHLDDEPRCMTNEHNRNAIGDFHWLHQIHSIGFLIGWESIVSTQGKEFGMLEDCMAILQIIRQRCHIFLCPSDESTIQAHIGDMNQMSISIFVFVPRGSFTRYVVPHVSQKELDGGIAVIPAMFTQGVNEMQTLANMASFLGDGTGGTRQIQINVSSYRVVEGYFEEFKKFHQVGVDTNLERAIHALRTVIHSQQKGQKDIDILINAGVTVRALCGGRVTFCKSGKDRTAMSVTLEQARILNALHVTSKKSLNEVDIANLYRQFGTRIVVAEKNVGRPRYSFNPAQRQLLPSIYRPPNATIQDFFLSVKARDS